MRIIDDEFFELCRSSGADFRFYFLTLTMKHREGNYLKELKDSQNKLFRSKLFKETFGETGLIQAFENVIKPNSYHIHSHNLIMARPVKKPAKEIQKAISQKWLKITGDSHIVSFDLVAKGKSIEKDEIVLKKTVKELLKYSTKVRSFGLMKDDEKMLLAEWIRSTKGKNFINARGAFRGLGLAANKSFLDTKAKDPEFDKENKYYLDITNQIRYSKSTLYSQYNLEKKRDELKEVVMKGLSLDAVDVSEIVESLDLAIEFEKDWKDSKFNYVMLYLKNQIEMYEKSSELELDPETKQKAKQMILRFCNMENQGNYTQKM